MEVSDLQKTRTQADKDQSLNSGSDQMHVWASISQNDSQPQTVDYESTVMKLSDEKTIRAKVAAALLEQKELIEKR